MPFRLTPPRLIYADVLYWQGNDECAICNEYPPDDEDYWVVPPCCKQEKVICFFCFTNKKFRRINPFGPWNRRHQWCKCPFCNAIVNLATDEIL